MGCSSSKLDCEESVTRCKHRKHYVKLAVAHRHAFAAAHAAYIQSLKNTGAAIRQFGEGEAKDQQHDLPAPANARNSHPLPPPVPHFWNLPRAVSMPPLPLRVGSPAKSPSMTPSRSVKGGDEEKEAFVANAKPPPPLPEESETVPPPPLSTDQSWIFDVFQTHQSPFHNANTSEAEEGDYTPLKTKEVADANTESNLKRERRKREEELVFADSDSANENARLKQPDETAEPSVEEKDGDVPSDQKANTGTGKRLTQVLRELDDQFLMAFESGKEVAKMLEARKMHYHSNFANPAGTIDHQSKVLRVMSWGGDTRTPHVNIAELDAVHSVTKETHASTLDKLLAWEKKLHDEVKAGEMIRIELERKSLQLKNQKKREEDSVTINKTKAVVKSLQTRYLVEFEAVDAAFLEIQKLRDDALHSQLVNLVRELMAMWRTMFDCHQQQYQLIVHMESLDSSMQLYSETNEHHLRNTMQLYSEIKLWHDNFDKLITSQKEYMNALYQWLRLNIIQIESEVKDKVASPPKTTNSPVYNLCQTWLNVLDQLPGNVNVALHALNAFSSIINEVKLQQDEELKQKRKLESLQKELDRKEQLLKNQATKYKERHMDVSVSNEKEELIQEGFPDRNPFKEREVIVDLLRRKVQDEKEKYEKLCLKSGSMTVSSLQRGLPPVLQTMTDFAHSCCDHYTKLYNVAVEEETPKLQLSY